MNERLRIVGSARRQRHLGLLAIALAGALVSIVAHAAVAVTGTPSVVGIATGPAGLKIEAKSSKLVAQDGGDKVTMEADLAALETGISLRDKHMREKYLEVGKFPKATLVVNRADLKIPAAGATTTGKSRGDLSMHGVSRPTDFTYTIVKLPAGYKVLGQFRVNLAAHKVEIPSYFGVTVGPDVDVTVNFELAEK